MATPTDHSKFPLNMLKHQESQGVFVEEYRSDFLRTYAAQYNDDVLQEWYISDFITNGDKVILKWKKYIIPLDDRQFENMYGRQPKVK